MSESERSLGPGSLQIVPSADYYENECIPTPTECTFDEMRREATHKNFLINENSAQVSTAQDCQKACEKSTRFTCRSISYNELTQQCTLSDVDSSKRAVNDNAQPATGYSYSEKTSCRGPAVAPSGKFFEI